MKKVIKVTGIFALISLVFTGCNAPTTKGTVLPTASVLPTSFQDTATQTEAPALDTIGSVSSVNIDETWTKVSEYSGDLDSDGTDETVYLYTDASRDKKGNIAWDDGQNWTLYIKDGTKYYKLVEKYVQMGSVYFEVSDYYTEDGTVPKVTVFISTGSGLDVANYSYDKNKDGYLKEKIYNTSEVTEAGINRRFSSIPEVK